jgi:hypothetical protein
MATDPSHCEWYLCDNYISDRHPGFERDNHPLTGLSWLAVLNPAESVAKLGLTVYGRENPPTHIQLEAPPNRSTLWELHQLEPALPRNEPFGLRLTADHPIIPQGTQLEFRAFERFPEATTSKTFYPGPLDQQREWYFADGYIGGEFDQRSWYEREILYLLNPGLEEAHIELTVYSERDASSTQYWVLPERLHTLAFADLPGLRWRRNDLGVPTSVFFSARVRSSVPIVAQKTRRDYVRFDPTVQGMWTTIGCPARVEEG